MFSVLIFFAISSSRSEAGVLSVCQLASRIFEGKPSVVHHFIDSRHTIHGFAKCFEKCPGNAPAFYSFNEHFEGVRAVQFDEARTGVIVWSSSTKEATLEKLSFISLNYYSWMSLFCHFFNLTDVPRISWTSHCCDAVLIADGFLEIDEEHVVFEDRNEYQQTLIFSTGKLDLACNKCGLASRIVDLEDASTEPSIFNKTLICSTTNVDWYFTVKFADGPAPQIGRATGGFEFLLMEDISNHLGFAYYIQKIDVETWGRVKNGTWTGGLTPLFQRRTHFALADLTILLPRTLFFDFTYPYDFDVLAFVSEPEVRAFSSQVFIELMDHESWFSLLVLSLITCAVLVAAGKVGNLEASVPWVIFRGAEFIFAALVQPNVEFPYKTRSGVRVLLLLWTTALFVLGRALSAALVMFIAAPGFEGIIDTMNDCADFLRSHSDARLCMGLGNYQNFFDSSKSVISQEAAEMSKSVYHDCGIWSKPRNVNGRILGPHTVVLYEKLFVTAELMAAAAKGGRAAGAHVSREHLSIMHQGILLQRGCALTAAFQNLTRILFETGHMFQYKRKLHMSDIPPMIADHKFSPLELSSVGGFVTSILVLETATVLVLFIEIFLSVLARRH